MEKNSSKISKIKCSENSFRVNFFGEIPKFGNAILRLFNEKIFDQFFRKCFDTIRKTRDILVYQSFSVIL